MFHLLWWLQSLSGLNFVYERTREEEIVVSMNAPIERRGSEEGGTGKGKRGRKVERGRESAGRDKRKGDGRINVMINDRAGQKEGSG